MASNRHKVDERLQNLLRTIDHTYDDEARKEAIQIVGAIASADAVRGLIACFKITHWRESKVQIIRALSLNAEERALEFLFDLAKNRDDLSLAAEAIVALGSRPSHPACEFLLQVVSTEDHPLQKEAIIGLGNNPLFPCDDELLAILDHHAAMPPTTVQLLILALATRRCRRAWTKIKMFLGDHEANLFPQIYNAALIAAGALAGKDDIAAVRALNTRYHFFAQQLQKSAITQIEMRSATRLDDTLILFLAADDEIRHEYLISLRDYAFDDVLTCAKRMAVELPPERLSQIAVVCNLSEDDERLLELLNEPAVDPRSAAARGLARRLLRSGKADIWTKMQAAIKPDRLMKILAGVADHRAGAYFYELARMTQLPTPSRIEAINAWVLQAQMAAPADQLPGIEGLLEVATGDVVEHVRFRMIRALGQVAVKHALVDQAFEADLARANAAHSSIYMALSAIGSQAACEQVMRRITVLRSQPGQDGELLMAIRCLSEFSTLSTTTCLESLDQAIVDKAWIWLVRILARVPVRGYDERLVLALESEDYATKMSGLAAIVFNSSPATMNIAFKQVFSDHPAISARAEYAVCLVGWPHHQVFLLDMVGETHFERSRLVRVLRTLVPRADEDCNALLRVLDQWLLTERFADDREILSLIANLRDSIVMIDVSQRVKSMTTGAPGERAHDGQNAEIDRGLAAVFGAEGFLSENIFSVLRNAELTFKHSDLFNDAVDKSTVVVEYVKSIDLFLQERFGPTLFSRERQEILAKMQSRVLLLQLDDESIATRRRVTDLQCEGFFSADNFPSHKLLTLAKTISSGKILREQYRAIDGLRAWALLLLVFGREFCFRGNDLPAILPVRRPDSLNICEISLALNDLQDLRNRAAHRDTMLQKAALQKVRDQSLSLLGTLVRTL